MFRTSRARCLTILVGAVALAAASPGSSAADEVCPDFLDKAVMDGAEEPAEGQYCHQPWPKPGTRAMCPTATRVPRQVRLTPRPVAGGVKLGSSRAQVCARWGRPALEVQPDRRKIWIYGAAAPDPSEWIAAHRGANKISWIISWCRHRGRDPRPECRLADRQAAAEAAGRFGRLTLDPPPSTSWIQVSFEGNRVVEMASWRPGDRAAGGFRPGQAIPGGDARCKRQGDKTAAGATVVFGYCAGGSRSGRASCTFSTATVVPPLTVQGLGHSRPSGIEYGSTLRGILLSRYNARCP